MIVAAPGPRDAAAEARAGGAPVGRPSGRRFSAGDPPGPPVGGIVPFSTVDFPGKLSAVLFLQGCPWRCGYCHNPHLQAARGDRDAGFGAFLRWLDTRRGLLDAVVFSGGEPTAHAGLRDAIGEVRDREFAVGLHTGGAYPRRLTSILDLVGWIGFDVKAPSRAYASVTGIDGSGSAAFASLRAIVAAGVPYEVRTTVHPALIDATALLTLAGELAAAGVRNWVLQPFRPDGCADTELVAAAPRGARIADDLVARLRERVPGLEVRR